MIYSIKILTIVMGWIHNTGIIVYTMKNAKLKGQKVMFFEGGKTITSFALVES